MQELIWYVECYGAWVGGGFVIGFWFAMRRYDNADPLANNN